MMPSDFIPFGDSLPHISGEQLNSISAIKTLKICLRHKDFELIELRHQTNPEGQPAEIIVVDCVNDQVGKYNQFGIKIRERLALVFQDGKEPQVRALRHDFPEAQHRNHTFSGEPAWLCLYDEPWRSVERHWTPQTFLRKILWWLTETSKGNLHQTNQAVEPVFFNSPFSIVFPPDYDEKINNDKLSLIFIPSHPDNENFSIIRGFFIPIEQTANHELPYIKTISIPLDPVIHGNILSPSNTLGKIHHQLLELGLSLITPLQTAIKKLVPEGGITDNSKEKTVLLLDIPVKRDINSPPERHELKAFFLTISLAKLGVLTESLIKQDGKFFSDYQIGGQSKVGTTWETIETVPTEIKSDNTKDFAQQLSGIENESSDFQGILAGVGALGGNLADLWVKEAWGTWTLIDDDIIKPHNLVRHVARDIDIGKAKVVAVKEIAEANYHRNYFKIQAVNDSATNIANPIVTNAIKEADIIIDATTSLEVPRDFATNDKAPRTASAFLSPSGSDSVLLLEDEKRDYRLDSLEAQYYRAIINNNWGQEHLAGHKGEFSVGAGCRDVSKIISYEMIQLHAAILAKQIRQLSDSEKPIINIWSTEEKTGATVCHMIQPHKPVKKTKKDWTIVCDDGILGKISNIRKEHLPKETGGVIVGFIDHKIMSVYIVDILNAPPDSKADQTGFTRGVIGLKKQLDEIASRTANIVGYLGEWHSHPPQASALPSHLDQQLIEALSRELAADGQPGLMVIAGEEYFSITIKDF